MDQLERDLLARSTELVVVEVGSGGGSVEAGTNIGGHCAAFSLMLAMPSIWMRVLS